MGLTIVSRAQWGARYSAGFAAAPMPASEVWLHHSVTVAPDLVAPFNDEDEAMRLLERIGQQRFGGGVSYTFANMPTGRIYEGHGVTRRGAHTGGRNSIARAIVLVGNHDVSPVTAAQIESTAQLLVHGYRSGWWKHPKLNGGHQQAPGAATGCPGRHGMAAIPRINARAQQILTGVPASAPSPAPGGIFMALSDAEQRELLNAVRELTALRKSEATPGTTFKGKVGDYVVNIDAATWQTKRGVDAALAELAKLTAAVEALADPAA